MRILKTILFALLALLILLVLGGLLLPSSARVQRSVLIQAPPAAVFEVVNSFKRFNEWSPWYELDPGARYLYSGPEQGVGARFEWSSSKPEVGEGSQQIIESKPYERVRTRLDFGAQGTALAQIGIVPFEQGSEVTWSFEAQFGYNLLQRYFGLLYDRWIGADFERGLARLKALLETGSADAPSAPQMQIDVAEVPGADVVVVEGVSSLEPAAVHAALEQAFARVEEFMKVHGLQPSAPRIAINRFYDESGWGFEAAVPYSASEQARARALAAAPGAGSPRLMRTYAGRAVKGTHVGPLEALPEAYRQLEDYVAEHQLEPNGASWEQYLTQRDAAPDAAARIDVFMPVKP